MICKFYSSATGCRWGNNCRYLHQKPKSTSNLLSTKAEPGRIHRPVLINRQIKESNQQIQQQTIPLPLTASATTFNEEDYDLCNDEDGIMMTWAALDLPLYAQVAKLKMSEEPLTVSKDNTINPSKTICTFYLSGNCKFGMKCRNVHVFPSADSDNHQMFDQSYVYPPDPSSRRECGICIEPASTALYGLLSHCDCKFCLDCIRGWRKEGLTVAKKAEQVRLCPLCRTESHFVVPSSEFVVGEIKQNLIQAYKETLSAKPCKYYAKGQECPFGTSCFYLHEEDGFKGSKRKLYKTEDEVLINAKVTLGDFLF